MVHIQNCTGNYGNYADDGGGDRDEDDCGDGYGCGDYHHLLSTMRYCENSGGSGDDGGGGLHCCPFTLKSHQAD